MTAAIIIFGIILVAFCAIGILAKIGLNAALVLNDNTDIYRKASKRGIVITHGKGDQEYCVESSSNLWHKCGSRMRLMKNGQRHCTNCGVIN